jgi:hypothetical protein
MPQPSKGQPKHPPGDLLWGVPAIAKHIERSVRQAQYLIETKKIPFTRLGPKMIVGSRSALDSHLKGESPN